MSSVDKKGWVKDAAYRKAADYAVAVYQGNYDAAKQNYDWLKSNNAYDKYILDGSFDTYDVASASDQKKKYGRAGADFSGDKTFISYTFSNLDDKFKELEDVRKSEKETADRIERENNFGNVRKGEAEIEAENAADANAKAESQATLLTAKGNGMDGHTMLTKGYLKKKQLGAA